MNGYGHFVKALLWVILYWLSVGGLLGILAIALARRGAEVSLGVRMKLFGNGFPGLRDLLFCSLCSRPPPVAGSTTNAYILQRYAHSQIQPRITSRV